MSKRNSAASSNTLFNYFTKTPPTNKKPKVEDDDENSAKVITPKLSSTKTGKTEKKKRERQPTPSPKKASNSEDESPVAQKKRKRIRLNPLDSDDSDVENKADNIIEKPEEKVSLEKKLQESFKYEPNSSPKAVKTPKPSVNGSATPKQTETNEKNHKPATSEEGNWIHCKLDWLKPDKIRDNKKRRPDHPDYDPTTLFVPPDFLKSQTPAHKQWWEMKSEHYDCVLFFKVGKFYELYHMDAAVGVNELGFSYMKGEFAHSGFPESAYGRMASTLIAKGYKVARVEQTETPEMMQERCRKLKQTSKFDKVVRREICQVTVRGTQVCTPQDPGPGDAAPNYMLALAEEESNGISTYGVCFVDASIGLFHLGQFKDDKHSSRLLTMLAQSPPVLLVYDRKATSARTIKLLSIHCHSSRKEILSMCTPEKTLKLLAEKYYRTNADGQWPEGIRQFLSEGDALGLTPASDSYLAIKALGGCVAYLTNCLLDIQVLGMSQFTSYSPPDVLNRTLSQEMKVDNRWEGGNTMVLDAITLKNLRIVNDEGCLYDKLNFCSTHMGKRLLNQWVCSPSCNLTVIKERQDAIKALYENQELCQDAKNILTTLPDMERLLAKVHALGNLKRSKDHPDARAIFYEEKTYSKRSVLEFLSILNGFTSAMKLVELFEDVESVMLARLMKLQPDGKFPDYRETLKFFRDAFNQQEAEKEGKLLPGEGVDQEYDNTLQLIADLEDELKQYLTEQEKKFKCRITYVGTDKKRYQLEIPESAANRASADYHLESARKGFKRFSTDETKEFLSRMQSAEDQKRNVLKDLNRRMFEKFSANYGVWEAAVQCAATLDVLLSFAEFARQLPAEACLPEVTFDETTKPYISIVEGRHPCIPIQDFIPNDTALGGDSGALVVLTGANMGGKSTLMRQTALIAALAHMGSYVPAESCRLSLVDRIFTRLGASDDILSGQSTFLVEMNETAAILKHATVHSLVLLDELGRGTSTYDGSAIAMAVCGALAELAARTIFSTHYHALVAHLAGYENIALAHMACMVETEEATDEEIPEETITFLYKLSPGACPKSYGFNAARLADIPRSITSRAQQVSRQLEKDAIAVRAFTQLVKREDPAQIRPLLKEIVV